MVNKSKHNSKEHASVSLKIHKERASTDLLYVNLELEYINIAVFDNCILKYNDLFGSESY
jgi:hypothetical protein